MTSWRIGERIVKVLREYDAAAIEEVFSDASSTSWSARSPRAKPSALLLPRGSDVSQR